MRRRRGGVRVASSPQAKCKWITEGSVAKSGSHTAILTMACEQFYTRIGSGEQPLRCWRVSIDLRREYPISSNKRRTSNSSRRRVDAVE